MITFTAVDLTMPIIAATACALLLVAGMISATHAIKHGEAPVFAGGAIWTGIIGLGSCIPLLLTPTTAQVGAWRDVLVWADVDVTQVVAYYCPQVKAWDEVNALVEAIEKRPAKAAGVVDGQKVVTYSIPTACRRPAA